MSIKSACFNVYVSPSIDSLYLHLTNNLVANKERNQVAKTKFHYPSNNLMHARARTHIYIVK